MLALLYLQEHAHGSTPGRIPSARALDGGAARRRGRALQSPRPSALAPVLFFRREIVGFRNAAERAVALNPMDGRLHRFLGHCWPTRGTPSAAPRWRRRAKQLNPNHPGWYWYPAFYDAYRRATTAARSRSPARSTCRATSDARVAMAAAYGQLGEMDAARKALRELLAAEARLRESRDAGPRRSGSDPESVEHSLDGLRKAGLDDRAPMRRRDSAKTPVARRGRRSRSPCCPSRT